MYDGNIILIRIGSASGVGPSYVTGIYCSIWSFRPACLACDIGKGYGLKGSGNGGQGLSTGFLAGMTRNPGTPHASGVSHARLPGVSHARLPGVSHARLPGVSHARLPGFPRSWSVWSRKKVLGPSDHDSYFMEIQSWQDATTHGWQPATGNR